MLPENASACVPREIAPESGVPMSVPTLRREERVTLKLREMFAQYGYRRYTMAKFEEFELYLENRSFLKSREIITFTDLDGRMLALRPDVTLSIAKNTRASERCGEKLYYIENVYRLDKPSGSYREIPQLGLESLGKLDSYHLGEVLLLAQKTLAAIAPEHKMQLSHIGFLLALLDAWQIEEGFRGEILECVRRKNAAALAETAKKAGISDSCAQLIVSAASLAGPFRETLESAKKLCVAPRMAEALEELEKVYSVAQACGCGEGITLDFSLVNDNDYYSGLVFQGFVRGVPRAVLAGGEYGNLLVKFGKRLDAIGFAVYLGELNRFYPAPEAESCDALLLYPESADPAALGRAVQRLQEQWPVVRAEREAPQGVAFGKVFRLAGEDRIEEISAEELHVLQKGGEPC